MAKHAATPEQIAAAQAIGDAPLEMRPLERGPAGTPGLDAWLHMAEARLATGRWRPGARRAMYRAIAGLDADARRDAARVLAAVDAAYPFGQRSLFPYKMWLDERRKLVAALSMIAPPGPDELAAIAVAADALEEIGGDGRMGGPERVRKARERALALLNDQAPNRHNLSCPACGAAGARVDTRKGLVLKDGQPCREIAEHELADGTLYSVTLLIPHAARLRSPGEWAQMPLPNVTDSGPLFASTSPSTTSANVTPESDTP